MWHHILKAATLDTQLALMIQQLAPESMIITIDNDCVDNLDISPVLKVIDPLLQENAIASYEQQLRFDIKYELEPGDIRELAEIPQLRQWFLRLDAQYPWLPFLLNWTSGELVRYAAMIIPTEFSQKKGIIFNVEALEIFLMHKVFILNDWLKQQGIPSKYRLKSMGEMFGYELEDPLFEKL